MRPNVTLWLFIGLYASLWVFWVLIGPHASVWIVMDPYGYLLIGSSESIWVVMGLYTSLCDLMGPFGSL